HPLVHLAISVCDCAAQFGEPRRIRDISRSSGATAHNSCGDNTAAVRDSPTQAPEPSGLSRFVAGDEPERHTTDLECRQNNLVPGGETTFQDQPKRRSLHQTREHPECDET